jgi:hypothetical protein
MTITPVAGVFEIGDLTRYTAADRLKRVVALPGKPYIALRIHRVGQAEEAGRAGPVGRVEDEL